MSSFDFLPTIYFAGTTICLRWRTDLSTNHDQCFELPEDAEDRHYQSTSLSRPAHLVFKEPFTQLTETFTVEKVKEMLTDIVKSCHQRALDQQKAEGHLKLDRGFATIPLPGIDVPFHSRYLWAGVMPFRACAFECIP
jgi:hypothetical protein